MNKTLKSILLVDDDKIANYLHEKLIKKLDLCNEVQIKTDGEEALQFLQELDIEKQSAPSLILLDINMPVLNGLEFIKKIQQSQCTQLKNIPIVILTTSTHPKDIEHVKNMGDYVYINKPLTKEKLLQVTVEKQLP